MLTFTDALSATEFHYGQCTRRVGPRGGVYVKTDVWRRNGRTRTWKTRPGAFEVPVKRGLYDYGVIRHTDAQYWHTRETCPLEQDTSEAARPSAPDRGEA